MKKEIPYIRAGVSFYKQVKAPTITGEFSTILVPWNIETIKQDHSKDYISTIPKYDGFTCIPEHVSYKQQYGTFYNTYFPLSNKPEAGKFEYTYSFFEHIFGEQIELGLDYLQLLYLKPIQILPILCLVSKERATGKSSFLKWLKGIFEANMTYLTNESFSSQFNAHWANKLLICIDEVLFNKEELTERIKYLSTTNVNKMEAKGKDKREVEFFGKFILCSNNEDNFIKIDESEIRFWVVKVPRIEREDTDLLAKMKLEIPAFLHFLSGRKLSVENPLTRMWFRSEQIRTKALLRLIQNNRSRTEREIAHLFISIMEEFDCDEFKMCPKHIFSFLIQSGIKTTRTDLVKLITVTWGLKSCGNSLSYQRIEIDDKGDYILTSGKGRYYTIRKDYLLQNYDELVVYCA